MVQLTIGGVSHFVVFIYYGLIISCAKRYSFFSFFALDVKKRARPINNETPHRTIRFSFSLELNIRRPSCMFFLSLSFPPSSTSRPVTSQHTLSVLRLMLHGQRSLLLLRLPSAVSSFLQMRSCQKTQIEPYRRVLGSGLDQQAAVMHCHAPRKPLGDRGRALSATPGTLAQTSAHVRVNIFY